MPRPRPRSRRATGEHHLVPDRLGDDLLHRGGRRARAPQPAGDPALPRADAQRRQPLAGGVRAHARQPRRADLRPDRVGRRRLRGRRRTRSDRRHLPPAAADRRGRAAGAPGMTTAAWIVLLAPLAGSILIALTYRALPQRAHGVLGTLAIAVSFAAALVTLFDLQD